MLRCVSITTCDGSTQARGAWGVFSAACTRCERTCSQASQSLTEREPASWGPQGGTGLPQKQRQRAKSVPWGTGRADSRRLSNQNVPAQHWSAQPSAAAAYLPSHSAASVWPAASQRAFIFIPPPHSSPIPGTASPLLRRVRRARKEERCSRKEERSP